MTQARPHSSLVVRTFMALDGRTSMRLEPELWETLDDLCEMRNMSVSAMVRDIEARGYPGGRTSAVRVAIVEELRALAGLDK